MAGECRDIPYMFMGTYQLGKSKTNTANYIYDAIKSGIRGFDTAPSYGTEKAIGIAIGKALDERLINRKDMCIINKIDGWQMQKGNISEVIGKQLSTLNLDYIDILLVHWPFEKYFEKTWSDMCEAKENGFVKKIGICNINMRVYRKLFKNDIEKPDVVQLERHPYNVCDELIAYLSEKNIRCMAYSPLCRMAFEKQDSTTLEYIANKYKKNIGQIILRWHLETGTIPVVKSASIKRLKENMQILDFGMQKEDTEIITRMNKDYCLFPLSWGCPGI